MYRILIADDESIERMVLHRTLQKQIGESCQIFQAENGREALEIWERERIQIAILDIEMPGVNGIEAAEKIRERDKNCGIIFLTAFDEFAYAKKAITVRALDYLLKPCDEKELMAVLEEAMHRADEQERHLEREGRRSGSLPSAEPTMDLAEEENQRLLKVEQMIRDYIHMHYGQDISMQELAESMNYSESYFCKLFKQRFGQNFMSYLTDLRIREARRLLEEPTVNVKEIGQRVGYPDSNYFAKVFKRITGQSPTEYRNHILRQGPKE